MKHTLTAIALACCLAGWSTDLTGQTEEAKKTTKTTKIARWARFELTLTAQDVPGNPFDVDLTATFRGPQGATQVWGFYAGGGQWCVRFMPTEPGTYTYTTQSSVAELNDVSGSLECTEPAEGCHGPVGVGADGLSFAYADGTVYHPVGTTSYAWMQIAGDGPERTIEALRQAKFNKVRMLFFPHNFEPTWPEPERFPFEIKSVTHDAQGHTVYEWDYDHFNPDYFDHVEWCIDRLAAIGVEADLIIFHPYDDGRWNFDHLPQEVNLKYVRYLVARLASFSNVWWSMANEYDFLKHWPQQWWDELTQEVADRDPYHHLLSIHSNTAKYYKYWEPVLTHASVQDQAPVEGYGHAATVRNILRKPVIFDEVCYEGNMIDRWGNLSGEEMLYRMWLGTLAGTYVGHGECYQDDPHDFGHDFLAVGREFQGTAWQRIGFMREVLDALPHPLRLADSSWDRRTSTGGEGYYLVYLGKDIARQWTFELPVKNGNYGRLQAGTKFRMEILDTWNMTVTPVGTLFETSDPVIDRVYDRLHRHVDLPGLPYLLLRIVAVDDGEQVP